MAWYVGVDVGGTFTDFYGFDAESGAYEVYKTPSTPDNPARAIVEGLREFSAAAGIDLSAIERFSHGTTVATNALLQRKGARVVLATTRGFKDLVEIGRQIRPKMYSLQDDYPEPVVSRNDRFEVAERVLANGDIHVPLAADEMESTARQIAEAAPDACAVCFLFAFLNPEHEIRLAERLRELAPQIRISRSSEVQPEFREYERLSTTVINAYLQPLMDQYLQTLGQGVSDIAPAAQVGINQSSGGLMSVERARRFPVRTALSGPAAGAMGALHIARQSGFADVVTLDMGGTSADVCMIKNLAVEQSYERDVGGFPIRMPVVDINTVGAGGGSIAWFDTDGLLKVGPVSAGAAPGPACYRKGGDQPTVSDANAVLGRLGGRGLIGGRMELDLEAARRVVQRVAARLDISLEQAAQGIVDIVNANMVRAIRAVSVERGHDPRELVLMPFGGAGALHATSVARSLGIRTILVPLLPGILCAQGLIVSDRKEDFVKTVRLALRGDSMPQIDAALKDLEDNAAGWFAEEAVPLAARKTQPVLDLRYEGQNYELQVPLTLRDGRVDADAVLRDFEAAHTRSYGYASPGSTVEVVNIRVTAVGALRKPGAPPVNGRADAEPSPLSRRSVHFDGTAPLDTLVYERDHLQPGHVIVGPAIIEQMDATTLVYPGDEARVDDVRNIIIEVRS